MIQVLSNPSLMTKIISAYILAMTFTGAIVLAAVDYATGHAIPAEVYAYISGAVIYAANQIGLHQGLVMLNTGLSETIKAQIVASKVQAQAVNNGG